MINVFRKDRDFLFRVRNGEFLYEELVAMANEKLARIEVLFAESDLPDKPDEIVVNRILVEMREHCFRVIIPQYIPCFAGYFLLSLSFYTTEK